MTKKITITNAYTWYNKGDAGILLGIINTLKKIYNDNVEFTILSQSPEEDKKRYCQDSCVKEIYSNILNPNPYKHTKFGKVIATLKLFLKFIGYQIGLKLFKNYLVKTKDNLKALSESDIIIVCGGGFLGGKKYDSLMHVYQMYVNTLFNKPVFVMGNSIEPMNNGIVKKYTEKVLKKMDYFFAREEITYEYIKTILPKERYCLIPDMAFMLRDEEKNFDFINNIRKESNIIFGITVRNWNFPRLDNREKAMDNYISSISKAMEYLINNYNSSFIFIPQVTVKSGDDTIVAQKIKDRLPAKIKEKFTIRTDDWSPIEIKSVIGNLDYFIGTRMHSNIFATSMKIPTTAIAYEKKTNGIMMTVNLDDYIIEIDSISENELINKVELMIKNSDIIKLNLENRIREIRNEILDKLNIVFKEEN